VGVLPAAASSQQDGLFDHMQLCSQQLWVRRRWPAGTMVQRTWRLSAVGVFPQVRAAGGAAGWECEELFRPHVPLFTGTVVAVRLTTVRTTVSACVHDKCWTVP